MWYVIIGLIIIGIIYAFFEWLSDLVGGWGILFAIIVILVVAFLAFSWVGILAVIGIAIGVYFLYLAGKGIKSVVEDHDEKAKETAQIKQKTQSDKRIQENDSVLLKVLDSDCKWLGEMNAQKWKDKLPNYVSKQYSTDFDQITMNFARQLEEQNILQSDIWFEPYKKYLIDHDGGATVTKMLNEVQCPQLQMTHVTPNGDLVNTLLMRGTEKKSKDVPALFEKTFIKDMNEYVFTPTRYLLKLYGKDEGIQESHKKELNFDDL